MPNAVTQTFAQYFWFVNIDSRVERGKVCDAIITPPPMNRGFKEKRLFQKVVLYCTILLIPSIYANSSYALQGVRTNFTGVSGIQKQYRFEVRN